MEQTFGRWKRRFYALHSDVRLGLENVPTFIVALAVCHNIAIQRSTPMPDDAENLPLEDQEDQPDEMPQNMLNLSSVAYKETIAVNLFSNV